MQGRDRREKARICKVVERGEIGLGDTVGEMFVFDASTDETLRGMSTSVGIGSFRRG